MANKNYVSGRRFEYKRRQEYLKIYPQVMRTAGSHGVADLICIHPDKPTLLVQCKRVETEAEAHRLLLKFEKDGIIPASEFYEQQMDVYVVKTRETLSETF